MEHGTDWGAPLAFKADRALKRKYLRCARRGYNLLYGALMLLGIAAGIYCMAATRAGNTAARRYASFVFLAIFLIVWLGAVYAVRWYHLDSRVMYRRGETLFLQKKELKLYYVKADGASATAEQRVRYGCMKALTMLKDPVSGLRVLQIDADTVSMRSFVMTNHGKLEQKAIVLTGADARRYLPLYYKNADRIVEHLTMRTGLTLETGTTTISELKEKRI